MSVSSIWPLLCQWRRVAATEIAASKRAITVGHEMRLCIDRTPALRTYRLPRGVILCSIMAVPMRACPSPGLPELGPGFEKRGTPLALACSLPIISVNEARTRNSSTASASSPTRTGSCATPARHASGRAARSPDSIRRPRGAAARASITASASSMCGNTTNPTTTFPACPTRTW